MIDTAAIRDFSCSVCDAPVAYRELSPPGVPRSAGRGGEHPGRRLDRYWEYISDGDREGACEVTPDQFARGVEALGGENAAQYLALYCRDCQLVYCFNHWKIEYSDGAPRSYGECPRGHGHVIDMG